MEILPICEQTELSLGGVVEGGVLTWECLPLLEW